MKLSRISATVLVAVLPAIAHAQVNQILGVIRSVQSAMQQQAQSQQQPVQEGTLEVAHLGTGASKTAGSDRNPLFGPLFGCDRPATSPLLSAFSLRNIRLGDVCAQTELTRGSPIGMTNAVANDMRQLAATQNVAITRLSAGGVTITLATLRAIARPAGLAKSVVVSVEEHVGAADATNSLQAGNAFRVALEQRYGKPPSVIGAREKLAADHKNAVAGIGSRAKMLGIDNGAAVSKSAAVEDQQTKHWVACHPADTAYELRWTNPDGTLLVANLADGECGSSPAFDLALMANPALPKESQFLVAQWAEPAAAFAKEQSQARSATASTPKF
ncbi:hypothetical protein EN871_09875 [bacterium M00.F.Ca.ET.228.01.1.1]|nr:hypothetical protein EN871_09875 [bacterium M00.F.Ca.ET.228.01.1.1]TGS02763.1 hypothetical protein EN834_09870 [bacterium M00.F.Ca.ET.191.01.1.1]TGU06145.1 hypothetical protein EN798_13950 [bacterium M00.F.Ca.ET.155.01.1.1]